MQYNINNYIFRGVLRPYIMNRYVFITLEWEIYIYIHRGSPYMEVVTMFVQ